MVYSMIYRFLFRYEKPVLGRWGYHWEKYKDIQKYYE